MVPSWISLLKAVRQITASLSFTRVCPCPPTPTYMLSRLDNMKRSVANMFSHAGNLRIGTRNFFSLYIVKENKTRCYSLDGVITSHNKPKLQTRSSLTEDCQKKLCTVPRTHHRATRLPPHHAWLWLVPPTAPSKLCHVGTGCFGKLETSPWGWSTLREGQCQVERLQIEALNRRK